jgi:hypothetical protein
MRSLSLLVLVLLFTFSPAADATPPEPFHGIYLPGQCLTARRVDKVLYYAPRSGINAVIVHAKDPRGRIFWESKHPLAVEIKASACHVALKQAIRRFKDNGIWVAAKVDVFIDTLLVRHHPEMGVADNQSGAPWADRHGQYWSNPFDKRVWEYNIALCRELVALGVDEIQFDYVRFPSDGDLARVTYPGWSPGQTRAATIGAFLASARHALKPSGITLSADLFGLTAWKKKDFGVGQVIEAMAPHVDVICPMLYPSHFPPGFLGWPHPGRHPREIMEKSLKRLQHRTDRPVRPWVQGFWYTPEEISAQFQGIANAGGRNWSVWHPAGKYASLYQVLAGAGKTIPPPTFYPALAELRTRRPRTMHGHRRVVNHTDYQNGYTLISLERPVPESPTGFHTLRPVLATLDEAIIDRILTCRNIAVSPLTGRNWKIGQLVDVLSRDLGLSPRRMRPKPIYIDWASDCRFSMTAPEDRMAQYRGLMKKKENGPVR